jgi:hypothetical protein
MRNLGFRVRSRWEIKAFFSIRPLLSSLNINLYFLIKYFPYVMLRRVPVEVHRDLLSMTIIF